MPSADGPPEQRRGGGDLVRRVAHGSSAQPVHNCGLNGVRVQLFSMYGRFKLLLWFV